MATADRRRTTSEYLLSVADHNDEDGRHAAEDDYDGQSKQRALRVAHGLRLLLDVRYHVWGADLQDASPLPQVGLKLLVDIQQFAIQEPSMSQKKTVRAKPVKGG